MHIPNSLKCLLGAIALLGALQNAPAQGLLPAALGDLSIQQKLNSQVPLDLPFRDESGRSVKIGDYFNGKPVILTLVYYQCPMLCTQVLNGLNGALKGISFDIGNQFNVVTVSIDPQETPSMAAAKKATYISRYGKEGAAQGWHFLTGDQTSIARLASSVGFRYVYDSTTKQFAHASGIMILTPQGRVNGYQMGVEYSPKDLRLSLVEASDGKIGNPVDALLLLCYKHDPLTGKYGLVIRNVIRLAGILTVLILGSFILIWVRKEKRAKVATPKFAVNGKQ